MYSVDMWNKILVVVMLVVGLSILMMSLYSASLAGLQRQMGMVRGDVRQNIDVNKFYRGLIEVGGVAECEWWRATAAVPSYIFMDRSDRVELGRELARMRRNCAVTYILHGNAERGVYTLLKSLRYDQVQLLEVEREIDLDKGNCDKYVAGEYGQVEAYLSAASGSAFNIIEREYRDVSRLQGRLIELCEHE